MRVYKTRPLLWGVASLVVFVVIGFAVRWKGKGEVHSMAGSMIDYFADLARGRDELFGEPFVYLAFWIVSAVAIGWLLQSLAIICFTRHWKSRTTAQPGTGGNR